MRLLKDPRLRLFASTLLLVLLASSVNAQYHKVGVASFGTTSTTFVDVAGGSLTFTPSATTDIWILLFSARLKSTSTAEVAAEVQYTVNGTLHGMGGIQNSAAGKGASWQHFYRVTGTTAKQTVQVQIRDATGGTATIEDLQIVAFRLPANADFQYSETEAVQSVPGGVWGNFQTLSFTPTSAGDYLILAVANGHESPGTANIGIRVQDPTSSFWPESPSGTPLDHMGIGRAPWQSYFLARVQTLAASLQTYNLQAFGSTGSSEVQFTRLMAFRTDAFEAAQSSQDLPASSTSSTTPQVKSSLTTASPPAARDYIVIQSLVLDAAGSAVDERRSGFDASGVSRTSYAHVMSQPDYIVSFGFFDAWTTDRSATYQNTFSTSNAAFPVRAKESVIHVLRFPTSSCPCNALSVTEGGTTLTVTSSSSFEAIFDKAFGGSLNVFYDLAEDPARAYNLVSRASNNFYGLFHVSLISGGLLHATGTNSTGAKLDLLEFTPTRVRVREESFFQRVPPATGILTGLKGIADYSVYPSGKMGVRWNRKTTASVPYTDHPLEMSAHLEAALPLSDLTGYSESDGTFNNPAGDDFILAQREANGVRTDLLGILNKDWAEADQLEFTNTVAFFSWRDLSITNIPANSDDVWNLLFYSKPTNFQHHLDPAVTGRRDDYRTPDGLSFTIGSGWNENPADADFFNESEAAYTVNFAPGTGLTFDMNGSSTLRYKPFIKIRQWRSLQDPSVSLESVPLTNDVHFRADVKPLSRAHFAQDLLWSSTLQAAAAVTAPDVGSAGTVNGTTTFVAGRYGSGALFDALNEYVTFTTAGDLDVARGAVELWYQPTYAYADNLDHRLWTYREDATHHIRLIKTAANTLRFVIINGATTSETIVSSANYSWRAYDWVHFRVTWDSSAAPADQLRIFFNGTEPAHTDPVSPYSSVGMVGGGIQWIGAAFDGTTPASGIIDELRIYGGSPTTPADLAWGGLTASPNESLSAGTRNFTFGFAAVDANRRGEYFYLGSDSQYRGVNVALQTYGAGTPNLQWQYWNGTSWANLEAVAGFTDETLQLTHSGTIYWTADPAGWSPYSVNGGPDLYYIRAYLASGSYSTPPEEWMIKTDILVFQYCGDVDLGGQTFAFGLPAPTAVTLVSFDARGGDQSVELAWATASEVDNIGFHLYRAESEEGPYEPITAAPIPGLGSSPEGARYTYTDVGLTNGKAYFYKLEDIETTGATKLHGPVSATPQPEGTGSASDGVPPPSTGGLTYGDPEGVSFRILRQDERGAVLELVTPGFYAEADGDGSVTISVPGFVDVAETGAPSLPVKRAWVDAVAGRRIELASVRASDVVMFSGLRPAAAVPPELEATIQGTVRPRAGRGRPKARSPNGTYPPELSRLVSSGFQGETKKALVELSPLRWNSSSGELSLARRLEVRLVFAGRAAEDRALDARRGRSHREGRNHAARSGLVARFAVREPGLQAVRFEEVFRRGRAIELDRLRLSRLGNPVAFHTEPPGPVFGPGSRLFFVSDGPEVNPYGAEAVYELELARGGARMGIDAAAPSGEAPVFYWKREEREENRYYQAGLLDAEEIWLWDVLLAPSTKTFGFTVKGLAGTSDVSRLSVWLQGASDEESVLDHHVRVTVNGSPAGETVWDGKRPHRFEAELTPGVLREGANEIAVENIGDAGARFSMVFLDRFEVHHPSQMGAESGQWEGSFSDSGWFEVNDIGDAYVVDVTDSSPRWLGGAKPTVTGTSFPTEAEHRYRVANDFGLRHPQVRLPFPTRIRSTGNRADYVLIGPRELLAEAGALLELRRSEGLRVMAVPTEEVFAEFGFGESRPEAVRDFLSYAYHHWQGPALRYVVLLGDGTYDYKNYLGLDGNNPVPPLLIKTSYLWTASDPRLSAINGEDELPDLAIGRLPASTREEARVLVEKIVAYEREASRGDSSVVLIADDSDRAGNFAALAEELSREVIPEREVKKIYLGELGAPATRDAILSAFDEGASLLSYLGHGGIHLWADENLLEIGQVSTLAAQSDQPLVLTMNCLNGYFHFPYFNSLAEELVKAEGKGAIAAFSPSGLSLNDPAHLYHKALLQELFHGSHARLGDAVLAAQSAFAEAGAFPELLSIYHLLGDPALRIRFSR